MSRLSTLTRQDANSHFSLYGLWMRMAIEPDGATPGNVAALWRLADPDEAPWIEVQGMSVASAWSAATTLVHRKIARGEMPEVCAANKDAWVAHETWKETGLIYDARRHVWVDDRGPTVVDFVDPTGGDLLDVA